MADTKRILEDIYKRLNDIAKDVAEIKNKQEISSVSVDKQILEIMQILAEMGAKIDLTAIFGDQPKKPKPKAKTKQKEDVVVVEEVDEKIDEKTEIVRWPSTSSQKKQSGDNKVVFFNKKYNENPDMFAEYITEEVKKNIQTQFATELQTKSAEEKKNFLHTHYYRYMSANFNDALISMKNAYNSHEHSKTKKIAAKEPIPISVETIMSDMNNQSYDVEDVEDEEEEENDI